MNAYVPADDAIRLAVAELYLFGESAEVPDSYHDAIATYIHSRPDGWDIEQALASELAFWRSTVRYHLHIAGLPRMEPPTLEELNAVFRNIAGRDLSIVRQMREN